MIEQQIKTNDTLWSRQSLKNPHIQTDKARKVQKMFNEIAYRYELTNNIISLGQAIFWRKKLLKFLAENSDTNFKPKKILDICCGTGEMAELSKKTFTSADVFGADFSQNMIKIAKNKKRPQLNNWLCADGLSLPFANNSFDLTTCIFGLRNYQSLKVGLTQIYQTLNTGGKLAALEFQPSDAFAIRWGFKFYFHKIIPLLGKIISKSKKNRAYEYLPQSVDSWYDIQAVADIIKDVGFKNLKLRKMCFGSVWAILAEK